MAKTKLSFFSKFVFLLNVLAILSLIFSCFAAFVKPTDYWLLGLFGLAYPVLLIINVLFVIYWILAWRWLFLLSLITIACGYNNLNNTFQFHSAKQAPVNSTSLIKVFSYNARIFDLYCWTGEKPNEIRNRILSLFNVQRPDILCIQEFCDITANKLTNSYEIQKNNGLKYHYTEYIESIRDTIKIGISTFSKYPIVGKGRIDFQKSKNLCIYVDVLINGDTIRVYNVHFQSIRFAKEDYVFVENIGENKDQEEIKGSKKIIRRLKTGFIKRAEQVNMVSEHIKTCPYPIIICGDFNDTPSSYTYSTIRGNLKDAFVENGRGIGNTYNGVFPSFRIDYILHDKKFDSYNFSVIKKNYSDHFPVTCLIDLKNSKK